MLSEIAHPREFVSVWFDENRLKTWARDGVCRTFDENFNIVEQEQGIIQEDDKKTAEFEVLKVQAEECTVVCSDGSGVRWASRNYSLNLEGCDIEGV